jgi:hypothetical protein
MSIEKLTREAANFQLKRDRNLMLNAEDLDIEFNSIVSYINSNIISKINNFEKKELIGITDPNFENTCIVNIGDGTTKWAKFNSNLFNDNSLNLNKFFCGNNLPGLLFSHLNQSLKTISSLNDNDILFSQNNLLPIFRKVKTGDIENNSLTNEKIAFNAISIEHFSDQLKNDFENPNITFDYINNPIPLFEGKHFKDTSIKSYIDSIYDNIEEFSLKFQNGTTTKKKSLAEHKRLAIQEQTYFEFVKKEQNENIYRKIKVDLNIQPKLINKFFDEKSFKTNHFNSYYKMNWNCLKNWNSYNYNTGKGFTKEEIQIQINDGNYSFTENNILDESISSDWIDKLVQRTSNFVPNFNRNINEIIEDGAIETRHIYNKSLSFAIPFPKNGLLTKEHLDPIIREKLGI